MKTRDIRRLTILLKEQNLTLVQGRKHRKVIGRDGHAIYSFASTPSCPHFEENVIKDLARRGHIPADSWQRARKMAT